MARLEAVSFQTLALALLRNHGRQETHTSALSPTLNAVRASCLFVLSRNFRLDVHVAEFARFEDLAAVETHDVFRVLVTGDYLDTRMETLLVHGFAYERLGVLSADWLMFTRNTSPAVRGTGIVRYFRLGGRVVKHFLQAKY